MTNYMIAAEDVARLMKAQAAIRDALDFMGPVEFSSTAQLELPLDGASQACETFMEEREALKAIIAAQRAEMHEVGQGMIQVSNYMGMLRDRLAVVGITYGPDDLGEPAIVLDLEVLGASLDL